MNKTHTINNSQHATHNLLFTNFAFTLDETLIVMGIIGLVAALTLPNLNSSTGDKEKVAKVKKIYQNLDDAYGRAVAVYGPFDEWFQNDSNNSDYAKRFATRLTEFMKVSKDCGFDTTGKCFTTKDKLFYESSGSYFENNHNEYNKNDAYKVVLADGTAVSFKCLKNLANKNSCSIYFDIDGPNKGSSSWGSDLFALYVYLDNNGINIGIHDDGDAPCGVDDDQCSAWIIMHDNADYLKTNDGKTCPNGKVLSWGGNTACK